MPRNYSSCVLCLLIVAAFLLIIAGVDLSSSFWLDETVTAWICSQDFSRVAGLVYRYQGQSPLYFWLLWSVAAATNHQEIFFRLPSVLAAAATLWVVYRLARRDLPVAASAASVLLLLANGDFVRALLSARPYALALLFAVLAISVLVRRIQEGNGLRLAIVLAVISFYFHYLIGLSAAAIGLIYLVLGFGKGFRKISSIELISTVLMLLTLIPGLRQLLEISGRGADYRFGQAVSLSAAFQALLPLDVFTLLLIGSVAACCFMPKRLLGFAPLRRDALVRALIWMLLPPAFMIALSLWSGNALIAGRYHLLAAPGAALAGGVLISMLRDEGAQILVSAAIALLMVCIPRSWEFEPWREAAASITGERPLTLISTGLVEGERDAWLESPEHRAYLSAPFQFYHVPGEVLPISRVVNLEYLKNTVTPLLLAHDALTLVIAGRKGDAANGEPGSVLAGYTDALGKSGFRRTGLQQLGLLTIASFSKSQE